MIKNEGSYIRFYQVGCGDAIAIHFLGNDEKYHNILIDGGTYDEDYYPVTFKSEINEIINRNEQIDLWIITHIHDDHIGGLVRFIEDEDFRKQLNLIKTKFWFNYTYIDVEVNLNYTSKISVPQAVTLRDFLKTNGILIENKTNLDCEDIFGAKLTLLSPNAKSIERLFEKWRKFERIKQKKDRVDKIGASKNDYHIRIDDFNLNKFEADDNPENNSSIAFVFEWNDKSILFSADSNPNIIENSIRQLGWSEEKKIKLDFMQLSHHGSKKNTSSSLLKIIECDKYIISANGFGNKPYKESLVRVLNENTNHVNFIFNYDEPPLRKIFTRDGFEAPTKYNFTCNFDMINENYLQIIL